MTKETVRFPDDLVGRIKTAVDESDLFESRSEFHRVSSELLLDMLDAEHEPTNFSYRELRAEIEEEVGFSLDGSSPGTEPPTTQGEFLADYVTVRRAALHGDLEGAREYVAERYDPVSVERLLLDEVIGLHRSERPSEDSSETSPPEVPGAGLDERRHQAESETPATDGGDESGIEPQRPER
jgi:Arc/MetJ-type ribon-helix-helix transcriptional regulator